jgi:hypothetical protein
MTRVILKGAVALAAVAVSTLAQADTLSFTGSMTGLGVTGPDASCAPYPFRGVISPSSTVGHSSLGDFAYSHSICLDGAPGTSMGTFLFDFGLDSFLGTMSGTATPSATIPGTSDTLFSYVITGGTGRFLGASGGFTGTGTADPRVRPSLVAIKFDGSIGAPAMPEPATWAMMLLGFGCIGASLRRQRGKSALLTQLA